MVKKAFQTYLEERVNYTISSHQKIYIIDVYQTESLTNVKGFKVELPYLYSVTQDITLFSIASSRRPLKIIEFPQT